MNCFFLLILVLIWHFTSVTYSLYVQIHKEGRRRSQQKEPLIPMTDLDSIEETETSASISPPSIYDELSKV